MLSRQLLRPFLARKPTINRQSVQKPRAVPRTRARFLTTAAPTASVIRMHLDSGNHKIAIPLPIGERVFSMRENLTVQSFVDDLLAEDSTVKSAAVFTTQGERVSRSTPVDVLLRGDWIVQVNEARHLIKSPPRSLVGKQYVSIHPDMFKDDTKLDMVKSFFENMKNVDGKLNVSLAEFLRFSEDKGVAHDQAMAYLRTLHKLGIVLYFEDNVELSNTIILNPNVVAATIENALKLPELRQATRASLAAKLEELNAKINELQEVYTIIDTKAARGANFIAYTILGGLLFQWLLFARLTWWDSSWDVMEPVTYFTMTAELSVAGYFYYMIHKQEYMNVDFWTILYNWRFRSIAKGRGFNIQEWNDINKQYLETKEALTWHEE